VDDQEATFYFFRHAQSEANVQLHIVGGRSNHVELTPTGRQQAARLGNFIAEETIAPPDYVCASPAVRTQQTARIALYAARIERPVRLEDALQELYQGSAEGKPRKEVYTPEAMARIEKEGLDFKHEGGQSPRELGLQGVSWLQEAYDSFAAGSVVYVFGHGYSIRTTVGTILGWDHLQVYKASTPNTCMTKIVGVPGNWRVPMFASNAHSKVVTH
jgi:broad specificity phosphatase PhoE